MLPASGRHYRRSAGSFAITLISNWNPYSQVTPIPVRVGCGASPQYSGTIAHAFSKFFSGSTRNTVTSITSSNVQPAAANTALRFSKARRTCGSKSGSGEPSSRLPTWPETNRKPLERIAGE
ncbi:hypothetical protein G6F22_020840 [Rhizopus arrhizus]|nr:hypothetical protein G6F22_020840 [Rhizopus arrhizus]